MPRSSTCVTCCRRDKGLNGRATTRESWVSYARRLDQRTLADIDSVVIHCTELPDLATAREYAEEIHYTDSQTGNCGHFYIDRDGSIEQWLPLESVAHHVRGFNRTSLGIELVNLGRYPNWWHSNHQQMTEPYPEKQIQALIDLLRDLASNLPSLTRIAGHEDLDREMRIASDNVQLQVRRKLDPGPCFPWQQVLQSAPLERVFDAN